MAKTAADNLCERLLEWNVHTIKFTGEVGVCMATSGRGTIHLLNDSEGGMPGAIESIREKTREFLPGR